MNTAASAVPRHDPHSPPPPAAEPGLDRLLQDINALEMLVANWEAQQANTVTALRRAVDALHREAFARLIRSLRTEPAAMVVLKESLGDEVVYAVFRHLGLVKPALQERLHDALESVRPYLQSHGGGVELVEISLPDRVTIRLLGGCDGCPASSLTLSAGVEKAIREHCPEIIHIDKAKGGLRAKPANGNGTGNGVATLHFVSPFARNDDAGWLYAARLDEIPEAGLKLAVVDGQAVLLSRFGDRLVCYQNACAHLGMPLDEGEVHDGILQCPYHHFEYDLESGECLTAPSVQLQTHAVRVRGISVEVKLL
jgi:nitrite reductase/ring-hydroxylating ferredoxin subunit/Fe-S cluster biogenesis protein NfuA